MKVSTPHLQTQAPPGTRPKDITGIQLADRDRGEPHGSAPPTPGDQPGSQIVIDQGTPYLAEEARKLYEELDLEHAPQKEGAATDKTLERSFRTVKDALAPLQKFCDRLSDLVPALKSVDCARAVGGLLLGVFLNVYRIAERKPTLEYAQDLAFLEAIVDDQRERARADCRSVKLALQRIHEEYQFEGSSAKFVRSLRRHRVDDILEAERRFRNKACRCLAKKCDRYFVGILRNVAEENRRARRRRLNELQQLSKLRDSACQKAEQEELFREEPEHGVANALDFLEVQYNPRTQRLFQDGKGFGRARLAQYLEILRDNFATSSWDRAEVGWNLWRKETELAPEAVPVIRKLFDNAVKKILRPSTPSTPEDLAGRQRW